MAKRLLCVVLSLLMIIAVLPTGVMASSSERTESSVMSVNIDGATTYYDSVNDALGAVTAGTTGTATLLCDAALTGTKVLKGNLTIDLGGHTLNTGSYTLSIGSDAAVVIQNGSISGSAAGSQSGIIKMAYSSTSLNMNGVTVTNTTTSTSTSNVIYLDPSKGITFEAKDCNFSISSSNGRVIAGGSGSGDSTIKLSGCTLSSAYRTFVMTGTYTSISIEGCTITTTSTDETDAAIYLSTSKTPEITVSDTTIVAENCQAIGSNNGASSTGTVTITGSSTDVTGSVSVTKPSIKISGGTFDTDVSGYVVAGYEQDVNGVVVAESTAVEPTFYGKNIVLAGEIGVKFYVDFTDVDSPESYSVKFTVDGNTTEVKYGDSESFGLYSGNIYYFQCDVPCWKMGATITAQIMNGDSEVGEAITYSVATYVTNITNKGASSTELGNLLKAMITYGYYSERYYESVHTGTSLSGTSAALSLYSVTDLSSYVETTSGDDLGVRATVVLDESCELRFYVPYSEGTSYTVTIDGETATAYDDKYTDDDGNTYTVYYIKDILVQNWDYGYTLKVMSGKETVCTLTYKVLSYANTVLSDTDNTYSDVLSNLVKAMYLYNYYADAYLIYSSN